jgi:uncharacterized NAD(P)/FAD-binding protein YdhS
MRSRFAHAETRGEAAGLVTLAVLCTAVALLPWAMQADTGVAAALSFMALGFQAAAVKAAKAADVAQPESGDAGKAFPVPPAMSSDCVAIIGSGFTGTMLAIQILRAGGPKVRLIERRKRFGQGLAYSPLGDQLLNVRASRMSAFPDDQAHFARWLAARGLGGADDFVPRRIFGDYLASLLAQARLAAGDRLELIRGDAIDIDTSGGRPRIALSDGRQIDADAVVLALGNLPPRLPAAFRSELPPELYSADPWSPKLGDELSPEDTILLLGTGLTMIDAVLQLDASGFGGRMIGLSRRGLLPRAHADAAPHAPAGASLAGLPLSHMVRRVRARSETIGWRAAVDELRASTHHIWRSASAEERARFLRHLRPWWDVHRHRVAPVLSERLERLQRGGRLEILAAKVESVDVLADHALIAIRPRGASDGRTVRVNRIVNCTGPSGDLTGSGQPLLNNLVDRGLVRADPKGLGIETASLCNAVGSGGARSEWLYAVGPIARGRLWEVTSVPDLRNEAAQLARAMSRVSQEPS